MGEVVDFFKDTSKPMEFEEKLFYRVLAQTDTINISMDLVHDETIADAMELAEKYIIDPEVNYRPFIIQLIGTANGWKHGHINFCPRCGLNIHSAMGDSREIVNNVQEFECPHCEANMFVEIYNTPEQDNVKCSICDQEDNKNQMIQDNDEEYICLECSDRRDRL
jgi:transposase-like protein